MGLVLTVGSGDVGGAVDAALAGEVSLAEDGPPVAGRDQQAPRQDADVAGLVQGYQHFRACSVCVDRETIKGGTNSASLFQGGHMVVRENSGKLIGSQRNSHSS